jgi:hypothetical protein
MYIDAHAHIDHYSDELMPQVLAQLEAQQQLTMSVAVDSASYARARMLAERSPWIIRPSASIPGRRINTPATWMRSGR